MSQKKYWDYDPEGYVGVCVYLLSAYPRESKNLGNLRLSLA